MRSRSSSIALLLGGLSALALAALAASALWRQRAWERERALDEQVELARAAARDAFERCAVWGRFAFEAEAEALDWPARKSRLERLVPQGEWLALEQRVRVIPPSDLVAEPAPEDLELFARVEEALRRGESLSADEAGEWARVAWLGIAHPGLKSEAALVRSRAIARSGDAGGARAARSAALEGPLDFRRALSAPAPFLAAYEEWRASTSSTRDAAVQAIANVLARAASGALEPALLRALAAEIASEEPALAEIALDVAARGTRLRSLERFALAGEDFAVGRELGWLHVRWPRRAAVRWALALPLAELERALPLAALERATEARATLASAPAGAERLEAVTASGAERFEALPAPLDKLRLGIAWTPREGGGAAGAELALLLALGLAAALGLFAALRIARRESALAARQSEFTSNVAHELRTPLAAVLLHAELLEGPGGTDASRRARHVEVLREEAQRLARLVDRVIALAAGRRPERALSLALGDVLERALDHAGEEANLRANAPLDLRVPDGEGALSALRELVDNARRHGKPPIEIEAELAPQSSHGVRAVEIRVLDRGAGVPDGDRARIFERFARGENAARNATRGAGLGLALVRQFAEECGGAVECLEREGGGACFLLRLTVLPAATVEAQDGSA